MRPALVCIIGGLLIGNAITPIIIDEFNGPDFLQAITIGFTVGCVLGQLNLLALWGAFGEEPFVKRILRCLSLLVWGCLAWILGFKAIEDLPVFVSMVFLVIAMGGMLVVMTPLLIMRRFKQWTIYRPDKPISDDRSQFAIRDMLLWTAIIAAQLTLGRITTDTDQSVGTPPTGFYFQLAVLVCVCGTAITCVGVPTAFAVLGTGSREKLADIIILTLIFGPVLVIESISLVMGSRPPSSDYFTVHAAMGFAGVGVLVVVGGALGIVRAHGYRIGVRVPGSASERWIAPR